jgi:hypothetical protein
MKKIDTTLELAYLPSLKAGFLDAVEKKGIHF